MPTETGREAGRDAAPAPLQTLVIDTNIVLDLLVFNDPATTDLLAELAAGRLRWLATQAMRDELERVLGYPKLAGRIAFHRLNTAAVLADMDRLCHWMDAAHKAPVTCSDADDQKFIDLACAERAILLSKDQHITRMRNRLANLGVVVQSARAGSKQFDTN